jgi:glutathione synthase/RimK-type ligase-like ATP-grasp enzyme
VFKTPARKLNKSRTDAAVKAVEALGLDFGAVDLVVDHQGLEYVLEVNTAPACSPKTLQAYAFQLANLIRERSNEDYILHPQVQDVGALLGDE